MEIKDYVVMQKPQPQATRLPPPRTLIMDYTMTHVRFGRSQLTLWVNSQIQDVSSSAFYWHSKDKIVALHTAP